MKTRSTQASAILEFYQKLKPPSGIPAGIAVLDPFKDKNVWNICEQFYTRFYSDYKPRIFLFGINPGRFGGGITGIPFTDPIRLEKCCGIPNELAKRAELSSLFIYELIEAFGGVDLFYGKFLFTALSPLGYTKNEKNLNYYDDKSLLKSCEPFILSTIRKQLADIKTIKTALCLGEGQNFNYFQQLNQKHRLFEEIHPLPHPRWIMQYRRKKLNEYVEKYLELLKKVSDRELIKI
ncbi:MAG TPA: uracil-DNA glycosylase family protein [Puia sp.]|nr:uracil-DNA glycosylase family protein [Puia sp.]